MMESIDRKAKCTITGVIVLLVAAIVVWGIIQPAVFSTAFILFLVAVVILGALPAYLCVSDGSNALAPPAMTKSYVAPANHAAPTQQGMAMAKASMAKPAVRKAAVVSAPVAAPKPAAEEPAAPKAAEVETKESADTTAEPTTDSNASEGSQPATLKAARDGTGDDLKHIKGVGPKMQTMLNEMGFYHFDQIAGWSAEEVAWVDDNLQGFKGRVSRDNWVDQAKLLAEGGETEFSARAKKGDVY